MTREFLAATIISTSARKPPAYRRYPVCKRAITLSRRIAITVICSRVERSRNGCSRRFWGASMATTKAKAAIPHRRAVRGLSSYISGGRRDYSARNRHRLRFQSARQPGGHSMPVWRWRAQRRSSSRISQSRIALETPGSFPVREQWQIRGGESRGCRPVAVHGSLPPNRSRSRVKIPAQQTDGTDAGLVHGTVAEAFEKIRRGEGPQSIEAQSVRWPGSETNWPAVAQPTESLSLGTSPVFPTKCGSGIGARIHC